MRRLKREVKRKIRYCRKEEDRRLDRVGVTETRYLKIPCTERKVGKSMRNDGDRRLNRKLEGGTDRMEG